MENVIRQRRPVTDPWQWLKAGPGGAAPTVPAAGDVLVPLALWREQRDALLARKGRLGIWLDAGEDAAQIAGDLAHFAPHISLVAVNFPRFADGRGYSTARLLRERYGYRGELRAVGDVLRDQFPELVRCGFDSFALRAGENVEAALAAFDALPEIYASSVTEPLPLFRRRLLAAGGRA
jgi:uncharacterized protein (DUF934 family)